MSANKTTCFIADLHLDPAQPAQYQLALDFFNQTDTIDNLYILGDLFEYWIGDDAGLPMYADVIASLAALSGKGCAITIMLGNRDFLLGEAFAEAASATVLTDDELYTVLDGEPILLMHGDSLCTDDREYQHFRQLVRDKHWQAEFLAKSIDDRLAYAKQLRDQSHRHSAGKTRELMDVNDTKALERLQAYQCHRLIHGHTHRPDIHTDNTHGSCRMVVGDWHTSHAQYILKDASGFKLTRFER